MKKIFIHGAILFSLLVSIAYAQQSATVSDYVSEKGGFSVKFPGKPEEKVDKVSSADGMLDVYSAMLESGGNAYLVLYTDYNDPVTAEEIDKILKAVSDGGVQAINGKVITQKSITLKGNKGISEEIETEEYIHVHNYYLVGQRLYQVIFTMPKGAKKPSEADVFIESFDIVTKN